MSTAVEQPRRIPYPSDLTDSQWDAARGILDPVTAGNATFSCRYSLTAKGTIAIGEPAYYSWREILNAFCYRWGSGCTWRMLPGDLPPWPVVMAAHDGLQANYNETNLELTRLLDPESVKERVRSVRARDVYADIEHAQATHATPLDEPHQVRLIGGPHHGATFSITDGLPKRLRIPTCARIEPDQGPTVASLIDADGQHAWKHEPAEIYVLDRTPDDGRHVYVFHAGRPAARAA